MEAILMKKLVILGLVFLLLVPLFLVGCGGGGSVTIALTSKDFSSQNVSYMLANLSTTGTLTVKLESNPSTGYSWADAVISEPPVVTQVSRNYVAPTATGLVGAPGTDVWVFNATASGAGTITFNYSQPWQGGAKNAYTLYLVLTVK
jgi:inhibitor of cysteine peptidase